MRKLTFKKYATGCGNSYLACAIGRQACAMGYKTYYPGMNRFVEKLALSRIDGTYIKLLNQLEKIPLIILDDFGLAPLDKNTKLSLLQVLEDRYGRKSTIITSQLPTGVWHQYLNEPTLADATSAFACFSSDIAYYSLSIFKNVISVSQFVAICGFEVRKSSLSRLAASPIISKFLTTASHGFIIIYKSHII